MKNNSKKTYKRIMDLLRKNELPMSMTEIARKLNIARTTAVKYIMVLEAKGKLGMKRMGVTKAYYVPKRPRKETKQEKENWEKI